MNKIVAAVVGACLISMAVSAQPVPSVGFLEFVSDRLTKAAPSRTPNLKAICPIEESLLARRVFAEYGSIFSANERVILPTACVFNDEAEVSAFRAKAVITQLNVSGVNLLLQKDAAEALSRALADAAQQSVVIAPLDGPIAAGRTYYESTRIWNSRFEPALRYWVQTGKISPEEEAAVRNMKLAQQVEKVIEWESKGLLFGTGRLRSIFSSTAPPGTSQHISLLAFDIAPPLTPAKRSIMNSNGWFQTILNDPLHFTYLGVPESELPRRGLKAVLADGTIYWVPNIVTTSSSSPPN
jgi:hypothetical protein